MTKVSESSVRPTLIVGADSRFATTFLSTKYRDKAVAGEALMDKTSGELFIKRVTDGKIVSFHQNKKLLRDLALDLRILLLNNQAFVYPSTNGNAYYVSSNYDLIAINNESLYNLVEDNITISGTPNDINKLTFTVSGESNGFICRNTTRDVDKAFIEYLTNQYNTKFKNYSGNNAAFTAEHEKFQLNQKWETSNAMITYDVVVNKAGVTRSYTNINDYIMINDDCLVMFPQQIYTDLGSFDYATVTIKSIVYDKLHFMVQHKNDFDNTFITNYNKFISLDGRIDVAEFNVSYFVDDASDVDILGNETVIAFVDVPHINRYMDRMAKLTGDSFGITISEEQPLSKCLWFKPSAIEDVV